MTWGGGRQATGSDLGPTPFCPAVDFDFLLAVIDCGGGGHGRWGGGHPPRNPLVISNLLTSKGVPPHPLMFSENRQNSITSCYLNEII